MATSYTETTSLNSHSIILVSSMNQLLRQWWILSCFSSASWLDRSCQMCVSIAQGQAGWFYFFQGNPKCQPHLILPLTSCRLHSSFVCEHGLSILATGCWGRTPPSRWESRLRNPWFAIPFVGNHYIDNPSMAYYLTFALLPHQEPHCDSANCATLCELHPRQCIVVELHCSHHPI